jgi:hypothetical protein
MKAKKIVSTDKEPKVILEMSEYEALILLDLLADVRKHLSEDWVFIEYYNLGEQTELFKSFLGL